MKRIEDDPNLTQNICFREDVTFFLNGFLNKHNCKYWDNENPHVFREGNAQFRQKINVRAGIFGDDIVGPIFIEENLTGRLYLNILENVIDPLITLLLEKLVNEGNLVLDEQNLHFQQDGASPHYAVPV